MTAKRSPFALLLAAPLLLAACDSSAAGSTSTGDVAINFGTASSAVTSTTTADAALAEGERLVIDGDNGQLAFTDVRMIVAELELDGDDDVNRCAGNDCDDFDAGPLFVDLPLAGENRVTAGSVPPGTYDELEFEIDDLDDSDDDAIERPRTQALLQQIRAEFADWPREASMLVVGEFRPRANGTLGAAVPFRVFLKARVRNRLRLNPPLVVAEGAEGAQVSVTFDPALIFRAGRTVVDLSKLNGRLVEFRVDGGFRGESHGGSGSNGSGGHGRDD